jgi:hypothetical protein
MGILDFFGYKSKAFEKADTTSTQIQIPPKPKHMSYEDQIEVFKSLGYSFPDNITKEKILTEGVPESIKDEMRIRNLHDIEEKPFSSLYFQLGYLNECNKCMIFDYEIMDCEDGYFTIISEMVSITEGELILTDIICESADEDSDQINLSFKINGIEKKWTFLLEGGLEFTLLNKLSKLPLEIGAKGKYTVFSDGEQVVVIDYMTESERDLFIQKTGLKILWLDETPL